MTVGRADCTVSWTRVEKKKLIRVYDGMIIVSKPSRDLGIHVGYTILATRSMQDRLVQYVDT